MEEKSALGQIVEQTYNTPSVAANYDHNREIKPNSGDLEFLDFCLAILYNQNLAQYNILDLGCGPGYVLSHISNYFSSLGDKSKINLYGIDVSNEMLSIANKKYRNSIVKENKHNLTLIKGDMRQTADIFAILQEKNSQTISSVSISNKTKNAKKQENKTRNNNRSNNNNSNIEFNLILSYYSIIHVPRGDHGKIIQDCFDLLSNNNGYLVLCTGNSDLKHDIGLWDGKPMFWSHFGKLQNIRLLEKCGFEIVETKAITDYSDGVSSHLFITSKKKNAKKNKTNIVSKL